MSEEIKINGLHTVLHMSMAKAHMLKEVGTIDCPDNKIIHGKEICCETRTPKSKNGNFGKPRTWLYLNEKDSPMFDSPKKFIDHYAQKKEP